MSDNPTPLIRMCTVSTSLSAHWAGHIGMVVIGNGDMTFSTHLTAKRARELGRQLVAAADQGEPESTECAKCGRSDHPLADEHADGTMCEPPRCTCGAALNIQPRWGATEPGQAGSWEWLHADGSIPGDHTPRPATPEPAVSR